MHLNTTNKSAPVINSKVFNALIAAYFFMSPLEFAFNAVLPSGSSLKYLGATIIAFQLLHLYKHSVGLKLKLFHTSLVLWLMLVFVSYFWSFSMQYALIYMSSYLNITVFFIMLTVIRYNPDQVKLFIHSTLWGSTLSSIIMLTNMSLYHGVGYRYSFNFLGAQLDPNNAAAFLCYGTVISFYYLIADENRNKLFYLAVLMINLTALIFTGSRGGFFTIILSFLLIIVYSIKHSQNKSVKRIIKHIVLGTILTFSFFFVLNYLTPVELLARLLEFESYRDGSERTIIWAFLANSIIDKPLLGYGIGSFPVVWSSFYGSARGVHNTYLMVLFDVGIIGFVFFVYPLIHLAKKGIKHKNILALSLLLISLVTAFFLDALVKRFFWNGLILCYMLLHSIPYQFHSRIRHQGR